MVFNIAAGALNIKDKGNKVSYNSYALAATELATIALSLSAYKNFKKTMKNAVLTQKATLTKHIKLTNLLIIFQIVVIVVNIVYSSMVIDCYLNNKIIDDVIYNFSIAIIAINSVSIISGDSIIGSAYRQMIKQGVDMTKV
jgi:hypothetical protein